jgi:multiple sugar transport system ATP-binding protein
MAAVTINAVRKRFGATEVIRGVDVAIRDGEFCVLVGPSGCGKSTLLRMIAGLEEITDGEIAIGDRVVNRVPPKERDIAMVFQNYALYPHMTVRDNMAFALKLAKRPREDDPTPRRARRRHPRPAPYLDRYPRQLSGGQRQRVAMGRAIVRDPQVFLFDEPLSNLDAKLRVAMRTEIKELHQRLKTTSIYVTHDQIEAMTMADQIVVMRDGLVEQMGDAAATLRPAGEHLRRGLHRLAGDEPRPRHGARQRCGPAVEFEGGLRLPLPHSVHAARARPCSTACARSTARRRRAREFRPRSSSSSRPGRTRSSICRFNGQDDSSLVRERVSAARATASGSRPIPGARTCSTRRPERVSARGRRDAKQVHRSPTWMRRSHERQQATRFSQSTAGACRRSRARRRVGAVAGRQRRAEYKLTPEKGAKLRVLRWKRFVEGDEKLWMREHEEVHREDRHSGAGRQRELGGRAPESRGGRQHRQRSRHHHGLAR